MIPKFIYTLQQPQACRCCVPVRIRIVQPKQIENNYTELKELQKYVPIQANTFTTGIYKIKVHGCNETEINTMPGKCYCQRYNDVEFCVLSECRLQRIECRDYRI
jgi:hypothetical protein